MKLFSTASFMLAVALSGAQASRVATIPIVFSGTDVSKALRAVSLRTGTGIVYAAGKESLTVSLDVTVTSSEEAVRCVASAAGLAYRKVGNLFVVALPTSMRQALVPYSVRTTLTPESGNAADLAPKLQEQLPHATVVAIGDRVAVTGVAEDVASAKEILSDLARHAAADVPATDVVILHQTSPEKISPLLLSLFPMVKVTPTPGDKGGAIALSGPTSQVTAARATIEKLDGSMIAEETVFHVYNLRYTSAPAVAEFLKQAAPSVQAIAGPESFTPSRAVFKPLTATLSGGGGFFGSAGGGGTASGDAGNSGGSAEGGASVAQNGSKAKTVVLKGLAGDVDKALTLLAQIDRKPKQIVVEVNVIETSPEDKLDLGIKYSWDPISFIESVPGTSTTRPAGLGSFSRAPFDFKAALTAMVTRKEAKILAKPRIQVIDNGEASVFVGDTIRARIVTGGALGSQNVDIKEFPVGIILLIAPRVNADGNITMHVNPVISTVTSIDDNNVPQTSAREAETTAIVKNGETVVLGGLIRDEDSKTVQEVPFLSKLPLVGELFRSRQRNHRRSDIMVSITPHIVEDEPEVSVVTSTTGVSKP